MGISKKTKTMVWQVFKLEIKYSDTFTAQDFNSICEIAPIIVTKYSKITGLTHGQIRTLLYPSVSLSFLEQTIFQDGFAKCAFAIKELESKVRKIPPISIGGKILGHDGVIRIVT